MHGLRRATYVALILFLAAAGCTSRNPTEPTGTTGTSSSSSSSPITADQARTKMRDVLTQPGVSFLVADTSCACAVVGVVDAAAEARVRDFARSAGLPDSAVHIERSPQLKFAWNLKDGIRPIKGGLQINNGAGSLCTMFGTVFHQGRQAKGLLTNSHCTTAQFAVDSTQFYQAGGVIGDFVAREVIDPPPVTSATNARCPKGALCRLSDVVFAQFDTSTVGIVGRIARTDHPCFGGVCTLQMLANDPNQSILVTGAGDSTVKQGTQVSKVGRTTGWTVGTVQRVCADVPVGGLPAGATPMVLLCQTIVDGAADQGDSGSPVFTSAPGFVNAQYVGILWGSADGTGSDDIFVYSPLSGVEAEIGALDYRE